MAALPCACVPVLAHRLSPGTGQGTAGGMGQGTEQGTEAGQVPGPETEPEDDGLAADAAPAGEWVSVAEAARRLQVHTESDPQQAPTGHAARPRAR
jgi:hypothetical protein